MEEPSPPFSPSSALTCHSRPLILDLYCGGGGCGMGYYRAGFDVVGVDIEPHPCNPHPMVVASALEIMEELLRGHYIELDNLFFPRFCLADIAAIHASPMCQFACSLRHLHPEKEYLNLIPATRELLIASGKPYVVENVVGASAENPATNNGV